MQNSTLNLDSGDNPKLAILKEGFQELNAIADPVWFAVEFENLQKKSGLRLTTFKAAYKAWCVQQQSGGGAAG